MKPTRALIAGLAATFSLSTAIAQQPTAIIDTSMGRITCELFPKQAPKAVAHFIAFSQGTEDWTNSATGAKMHNRPLYNGTTFHRVIAGYMVQGGDPTGTGKGGPGFSFKDEFDPDLTFDRPGRLAMANSGPNSNGSQFFITIAKAEALNRHHTIFGQCDAASLFIVRAIAGVPRDSDDKPLASVVLKKITIIHKIPSARGSNEPSSPLWSLEKPDSNNPQGAPQK
jgi:peptidyl-prolyl cis-trans isomerase A (cyclophilin A)